MKKLFWFALVVLMLSSALAYGDTLTLVAPPPGPSYGPYYISPYSLQLNSPTGPVMQLTCIDPLHNISQGDTWTVDIIDVSGIQSYQEFAWLILQYTPQNAAAIQYAIWDMVSPGFALAHLGSNDPLILSGAIANWEIAAASPSNYETVTGGLTLYRPNPTSNGQEFLRVPEPSLLILMGMGILAVSLVFALCTRS